MYVLGAKTDLFSTGSQTNPTTSPPGFPDEPNHLVSLSPKRTQPPGRLVSQTNPITWPPGLPNEPNHFAAVFDVVFHNTNPIPEGRDSRSNPGRRKTEALVEGHFLQ